MGLTSAVGGGRAVRYWAAVLMPIAGLALTGLGLRRLDRQPGTVEVGVIGGDLPYWRAKEAVRIGEAKLSNQVQASQALEVRAISLIGWSVTGFLALGAAVAGGTHVIAAGISAAGLFMASALSTWSIIRRGFYTGYPPLFLIENRSSSEYEILVSMAEGYQRVTEQNAHRLRRSARLIGVAIILLVSAPIAGLTTLILLSGKPSPPNWRILSVRGASAWGVCRGALGSRECGPCVFPVTDDDRALTEMVRPGQDCDRPRSNPVPFQMPGHA